MKSLRSFALFKARMPAFNHDAQDNLMQANLILVTRRNKLKGALSRTQVNKLKRKRHYLQKTITNFLNRLQNP